MIVGSRAEDPGQGPPGWQKPYRSGQWLVMTLPRV